MPVKIINPGSLEHINPKHTLTCDNCGCEFECNESDATPSSDQRDNGALHITCPYSSCKKEIWFNRTPNGPIKRGGR